MLLGGQLPRGLRNKRKRIRQKIDTKLRLRARDVRVGEKFNFKGRTYVKDSKGNIRQTTPKRTREQRGRDLEPYL